MKNQNIGFQDNGNITIINTFVFTDKDQENKKKSLGHITDNENIMHPIRKKYKAEFGGWIRGCSNQNAFNLWH